MPDAKRESIPGVIGMINGRAPWYIRLALVFLIYFGPWMAIATYYLARDAGYIESPITETHVMVRDLHEGNAQREAERVKRDERIIDLLESICRHVARSSKERDPC